MADHDTHDHTGVTGVPASPSGALTGSGYTMATARLLGRTTGSAGAVEEITVGSGLTLSAGSLAASGSSAPIASGTSNPGSPSNNDLFYRTDLDRIIFYDGTRWLCTCVHQLVIQMKDAVAYTGISGTTDPIGRVLVPYKGTFGLYMERWEFVSIVVTTNDGTKFWSLRLYWVNAAGSATNLATGVTTASDTATTHAWHSESLGAVLDSTAVYVAVSATKTSTAGNFFTSGQGVLHYRYVIT